MPEFVMAGIATSTALLAWLIYRWQKELSILTENSRLRKKQVITGFISAGLFFVFLLVFKNLLAGALAVILYGLYLKRKEELNKQARNMVIESQAEVALQLIASFYENTGDIMTALIKAADCIQPPLADELRLTVTQYNANKGPLLALQDMAQRLDNRDINIFVNAVVLSERYGTNTGKVINDVSRKISDRISLRDELKNEVWGQGITIKVFFFILPILTCILMLIPDVRQVLTGTAPGKIIISVLLIVEYYAWYFSTNQEVVDQL